MADLLKLRDKVLSEHAAQEKYDPHWVAEAKEGRRLSDRPVAFQCDDEVVVKGPCADKVRAALAAFAAREGEFADRLLVEPWLRQAFAVAKKFANRTDDLVFTSQQWNGAAYALAESKLLVALADGKSA